MNIAMERGCRSNDVAPSTHERSEIFTMPELAARLHRMMKQNAMNADYVPFSAIARYVDIHRDTIYEAAKGRTVNRHTHMLLSDFLIRLEVGELEARQTSIQGRYEIFYVENPKPRLWLRVDLTHGASGLRFTDSPYQPPRRMPSFASVFGKKM